MVNNHGTALLNICHKNAMVVPNHFITVEDLSFRRHQTWTYEVDLRLAKSECVDLIKDTQGLVSLLCHLSS